MAALHKSLRNKGGFGRVSFKPCWHPSKAQSHRRLAVEICFQKQHENLTLSKHTTYLVSAGCTGHCTPAHLVSTGCTAEHTGYHRLYSTQHTRTSGYRRLYRW